MRPRKPAPYVGRCSVCEDGLLRLFRCCDCGTIVAMCDECELIWRDVAEASRSAKPKSDAAFPACPACDTKRVKWFRLNRAEIRDAGFETHLADSRD